MERELTTEEKAILERICAVCVDQRDDGSCGLDADLECALKLHLPKVLAAVKGASGPQLDSYVAPLRDNICSVCDQGEPEECDVRAQVDCPLDRYYGLIVEAIEDYRREQEEPA